MNDLQIKIYTHSKDLPVMPCRNLFHSVELFRLYEQTPRHTPYMVVAQTAGGDVLAHLLAVTRCRWSFFPPYIYMHCHVFGEGEYTAKDIPAEELFMQMTCALDKKMRYKVLYTEYSNLSTKMFGYKVFRCHDYFPVHWMSIHNSLHNKNPEERLNERTSRYIKNATNKGVVTKLVDTETDFEEFSHLLRCHNRLKPRKYIPDDSFFKGLMNLDSARLFLCRYKEKAIGCCACVYSGGNAYLWYMASLRKSYLSLHPDTVTIWAAIRNAYEEGCDHIFFMDVGLPFKRNPFREFILKFGGKPVSTYRWFHIYNDVLNRIFSWIYRE